MAFTHDWFSGNIPNWTTWFAEFKDKPIKVLEIGCYEGMATLWLLENILGHPRSSITVIDTFGGSIEHGDVAPVDFSNVRETFMQNTNKYWEKILLIEGKSQKEIPGLIERYNIIYIDGSHKASDTITDAALAWQKLLPGGIMVFDDYAWLGYPDKPSMNPYPAINAFLHMWEDEYKLIHKDYQVAIRKIRS